MRDLGSKPYFRITLDDLKNLERTDFVMLTLPEGKLNIPVGVLLDRFASSVSWNGKGVHSSSTFPVWLASYRQSASVPP